ncbi:Uncharacterized protein TCM_032417 [Theobroma cacao]|uniref:Uncharacterized protein n=1 Tax=Theobroma cacao TaxID=3641 RepID=A0A061FAP7_THECC|nr:Uncharacterized protein TCM_032417 [Theobroma cacao]
MLPSSSTKQVFYRVLRTTSTMGFTSKMLGALKSFGGCSCMGTPKADNYNRMKKTDEPCEGKEVANESINSKNDALGQEQEGNMASVNWNQVTVDSLVYDEVEEEEEEEDEESARGDDKQVKNYSEEKPKSGSED